MTAADCCIGNPKGLAYTLPDTDTCHVCIGKFKHLSKLCVLHDFYYNVILFLYFQSMVGSIICLLEWNRKWVM